MANSYGGVILVGVTDHQQVASQPIRPLASRGGGLMLRRRELSRPMYR